MARRRRADINVENVRRFRERGVTYAEIGEKMGYSAAAVWRAYNQPGRVRTEVPAGKQRSTYLPDEHWELLRQWALLIGESRAVMIARLIEEEAGRRGAPKVAA